MNLSKMLFGNGFGTALGRENEMYVEFGERLRHDRYGIILPSGVR